MLLASASCRGVQQTADSAGPRHSVQCRGLTLLLLVGCTIGLLLRMRAIVGPRGRALLLLRRRLVVLRRRPVLLRWPWLVLLLLLLRLVVLLRGPCRIVCWS